MTPRTDSNNLAMRHRYQHHVDALLAELAERRQRINVLKTWGVQAAGLHQLKEELGAVRVELAATTAASSTTPPAPATAPNLPGFKRERVLRTSKGKEPPEFASDHPGDAHRIEQIENRLSQAEQALAAAPAGSPS
jgi:hypothetical protein